MHYRPIGSGREVFDAEDSFVTADIVVLSAGTLGSTEILHRSRSRGLVVSNQLGARIDFFLGRKITLENTRQFIAGNADMRLTVDDRKRDVSNAAGNLNRRLEDRHFRIATATVT